MNPALGKTVLYGESTDAETAATVVEGGDPTFLSEETTFGPVRRGVACRTQVQVFAATRQAWAVVDHLDVSGATLHMPFEPEHLSVIAIALPLPRAHGPTEGRAVESRPSDDGGMIVEITFVNVDEQRRDDLAKVVQALKKRAAKRTPS
jgi:hypothetical protein